MAADDAAAEQRRRDMERLVRRMRTDWEFYSSNFLKIKDKSGAIVPFRPNSAQRLLHEAIEKQRKETGKVRIIGVKGRQQGFSTYVEGRFFQKVSLGQGQRAFILTHLDEATGNLFGMTRRYLDNLPPWAKPTTRANSATGLAFDVVGGEFSVATAQSKGTGRSATAQLFHGSEVAYWANALDHMAGIGQVVPNAPGTEIILESTANGVGNLFHSMVADALKNKGEYRLVFVPWMVQAEYAITPPEGWAPSPEDYEYGQLYKCTPAQLYWRRLKLNDELRGDTSLFDQEYPATLALAFRRVTGDVFIVTELVQRARQTLAVEAKGARILGLDPAEYGDDSTVAILRQGRDAGQFYRRWHKKGPMQMVGIIANLCDQLKPDMVNIDVTGGYGSGIADRLRELNYPVNRVSFGETAIKDEKYPRRMDEMWGDMKDWLLDTPCRLPDDEQLQIELTTRQFSYDSARRTVLESKEHMRKRGVSSPDGGDALALTFALPARPKKRGATETEFQNPGGIGY